MAKPFRFEELLARVRLRLRAQGAAPGETSVLKHGALQLDLRTRRMKVGNQEVDLSAREFALAETFLRHPGDVLTRERLLSEVWGFDFDPGSNVVDVYVRYLRRKVGAEHFDTVRGVGYRLIDATATTAWRRVTRDLACSPRPTCTCTSRGRCASRRWPTWRTTHGIRLPSALLDADPLHVPADERGWFRFQRLYDAARACVRSEADMRRIVAEAAQDDAAEGSGRLEIQVDPTSYAPFVGGLTPALEIVLDAARQAAADTGVDVGVIVAASRMRHPLEARTLARLAAHHAGDGPGQVVGFGLSNDERRGETSEFAPAFAIARRGRAWRRCRTAASCWDPRTSRTWSVICAPTGSGTACGPRRTRGCSSGWSTRASRSRCAPRRTCRSGCTRPRPTSRCAPWSTRARRWRSAPTTRSCSTPGWWTST